MALFDFFKKKTSTAQSASPNSSNKTPLNSFGEPLDRLTAEGELPWGWVTHNKTFVDKIQNEYSHFLNGWLDSRTQEPLRYFEALKSFVLYLEDVEHLCESKGECFVFWFNEILTSKGYLDERRKELQHLQSNFRQIEEDYKRKKLEDEDRARKVIEMRDDVIQHLKSNDGILQSDFWKLYNEADRGAVQDIVYSLIQQGKVEREKSGRSFILHFK